MREVIKKRLAGSNLDEITNMVIELHRQIENLKKKPRWKYQNYSDFEDLDNTLHTRRDAFYAAREVEGGENG